MALESLAIAYFDVTAGCGPKAWLGTTSTMAHKLPLSDFRARRHKLEPHEFALSNLPEQLSVSGGEMDLIRAYFADLINDVLNRPQ